MGEIAYHCAEEETLDPPALAALQRRKLAAMLRAVMATNPFYRRKLAAIDFDPLADPIETLPFTTRAELEQRPGGASAVRDESHPAARAIRPAAPDLRQQRRAADALARHGRQLAVVEEAVGHHLRGGGGDAARTGSSSRSRSARSSASGARSRARRRWATSRSPRGGMTTPARLRFMLDNACTVVCCTPTYALRMAEVAAAEGIDLPASPVTKLIVAGEPGGSIPATRQRIEHGVGRARLRPHRHDRDRRAGLRVRAGARRRPPDRERVHRRGDRPGDRPAGRPTARRGNSSSRTSGAATAR